MSNLKFSIITVCYNAEASIEKTISSYLKQDYLNKELVIIDGGSTDGTKSIINQYIDNISFYLSERDNGIYDAMNKAVKYATGDFVLFLNSGDVFYSEDVLYKASIFIKNVDAVYYGDFLAVRNKLQSIIKQTTNVFKISRNNLCHQSIFYPLYLLKNYPYNLKYRLCADWDLNIRLMKGYNFFHLPFCICEYNYDGISSKNLDFSFMDDLNTIIKDNLGFYVYLFTLLKNLIRYHSLKIIIKR